MLAFMHYFPLLAVLLGLAMPTLSTPLSPQAQPEEAISDISSNSTIERRAGPTTFSNSKDGIDPAGFYHSLYNDNKASARYTEFPDSGRFQLAWNTPNKEFLGGKGFKGVAPRSITWDGSFRASGDWTLGIYGWTQNPVTEWYVVESHGDGVPGNGHILGQVYSDGGVYDVYSLSYNNVPKIYGATSFKQYWSVRRNHRSSGTVNVAAHFDGWRKLGLKPGNPVFQMITLEGFKGEGSLDFTVRR